MSAFLFFLKGRKKVLGRIMLWASRGIIYDQLGLCPSDVSQRAVRSPSPSIRKGKQWVKELGRCFQTKPIPFVWHCPLPAWLATQQRHSCSWAVAAHAVSAWMLAELGPHCDRLLLPPHRARPPADLWLQQVWTAWCWGL